MRLKNLNWDENTLIATLPAEGIASADDIADYVIRFNLSSALCQGSVTSFKVQPFSTSLIIIH